MTKVTILGEDGKPVEKKKPIEFLYWFRNSRTTPTLETDCVKPTDWKNVLVLSKGDNFSNDSAIFWGYDDKIEDGTLYLGNYNDGVVE